MTDLIAGKRAPHTIELPDPHGCHWCGQPSPHGLQYIAPAGLHQWTAPTREQRYARMLERRADRIIARGCTYETCGTRHPRITLPSGVIWCWHHARWEEQLTEGA